MKNKGRVFGIFAKRTKVAHSPTLFFDGKKFTNNGEPKAFSFPLAWKMARGLIKKYQHSLRHYRVWVRPIAGRRTNPKKRTNLPFIVQRLYKDGTTGIASEHSTRANAESAARRYVKMSNGKLTAADFPVQERRSNPESRGVEEAAKKFEDFTGHKANTLIETNLPAVKEGLVIGELDLIGYRVKRDGIEGGKLAAYDHVFRKHSRPLLAVSKDGKQLLIVGGRYEFTEAGIEDR